MDLRKIVEAYVDKAIDGTINYSGEDKDANRHIWVQLITDRIIGSFMGVLPDPIDIEAKYEADPSRGLTVRLKPEDDEWNELQIEQMAHYASDRGYNDYRFEVENIIMKPYNLQKAEKSAKLISGEK